MGMKKFHPSQKTRNYLAIAFLCLISGFFLAQSMNTHTISLNKTTAQNKEDLIASIRRYQSSNQELEQRIKRLRQELAARQEKMAANPGQMGEMSRELEEKKVLAGLTKVSGPGVVVTVADIDPGRRSLSGPDAENFIVHDGDLVNIVYALRRGGAEAIAINGQRVVSTSDIRCGGSIILVNRHWVGSPFKIEAIGDPDRLYAAVTAEYPLSIYPVLKENKFPVSIEKKKEIILPEYNGSYSFSYAKPVKEGER